MSRIPVRRSVAAVALALAATLVPGVVAAEPSNRSQSVGDLQAQAKQVAAQLAQMQAKSDQLDESYNQAQLDIAALQQKIDANEADVASAQTSLQSNEGLAKQYAINAYMDGGPVDPVLMPATDTADASHRKIYLTQLQGDKAQVISDVGAAQQDLADKQAALASLKKKADAKAASLASTKRQLESTITDQKNLIATVNGTLATAVAAEQQRVAAQREAEAQRAAQEQADRDAATAARARQSAAAASSSSKADSADDGSETDLRQAGDDVADTTTSFPDPGPIRADIQTVLDAAQSQLGVPYHWGASSPGSGFDCSGLVLYAYSKIGVSLPHSSRAQRAMTQRISADALQPGDLVFYGNPVHHVGIYIGSGQIVHAPHTGDVVKVSSMYSVGSPSFGRI